MDPGRQRDLQHIALPTACALVYARVTGGTPDPREAATLNSILNDVAFALSNLVPVYADDAQSALPKPVNPRELIDGRFGHGAHVFTTSDGRELGGLSVQRRDMDKAIEILRTAGVRFPRPGLPPG